MKKQQRKSYSLLRLVNGLNKTVYPKKKKKKKNKRQEERSAIEC